jgi:hypothetical protein
MDISYAEVGTEVVIAFHRQEQYHSVQRYIGRKTFITKVDIFSKTCKTNIDGEFYWWPVRDMILASDIDLLTPEQKLKIKP